jgi:hypothetical protein
MKIASRQVKMISAVVFLTTLTTWFYYAHETFPKPLRAVTALFATPVAVASGLSYYLNVGIPVYETPWAVVLANLIFSLLIVFLAEKVFNSLRTKPRPSK